MKKSNAKNDAKKTKNVENEEKMDEEVRNEEEEEEDDPKKRKIEEVENNKNKKQKIGEEGVVGKVVMKCNSCNKVYKNKKSLIKHENQCTKMQNQCTKMQSDPGEFNCPKCNRHYDKSEYLANHQLYCKANRVKLSSDFKTKMINQELEKLNENENFFDYTNTSLNFGKKINVHDSYLIGVKPNDKELAEFKKDINAKIAKLKNKNDEESKFKLKILNGYKNVKMQKLGKFYSQKNNNKIVKFIEKIKEDKMSDFKTMVIKTFSCYKVSYNVYDVYLNDIATNCLSYLSCILLNELINNIDKRPSPISSEKILFKCMFEHAVKNWISYYSIPEATKKIVYPKKLFMFIANSIYKYFDVDSTEEFLEMALSSFEDVKMKGVLARLFLTMKIKKEAIGVLNALYLGYINLCIITFKYILSVKSKNENKEIDFKTALCHVSNNAAWFCFKRYLNVSVKLNFDFDKLYISSPTVGDIVEVQKLNDFKNVSEMMPDEKYWKIEDENDRKSSVDTDSLHTIETERESCTSDVIIKQY